MTAPPLSLTILRKGDTNIIDLAGKGVLIPRSEIRVDDAFLHQLVAEVTRVATPGLGRGEGRAVIQELQRVGELLFSQLLTESARERLRTAEPCALYLRLDEQLVHLPWEFCYDGEQFLALKFRLGRQVITSAPLPQRESTRSRQGVLRVLLIADPTETLPQASQEAEQLCELLGGLRGVEVTLLGGQEVRKAPLLLALQAHDLVHFAGHSEYDAQTPSRSGWVLHEGMLTAGELRKLARPPLLVFSNSCQAGVTTAWQEGAQYDKQAFGIGSAFLLAGVQHYVGTFWGVPDEESTAFATVFYRRLTAGQSIGEALGGARHTHLAQRGWAGLTWASYMLYGDPSWTLLPTTKVAIEDRASPSRLQSFALSSQHPVANLVGRETELAQLHQWLEKALRGERQVVFITGEPGIGKTTLVDAFLSGIRRQGTGNSSSAPPDSRSPTSDPWIAEGQCIEHYGVGEAYLPVLSALGQLCREPEGQHLAEILGQHAPTWLVQMPALLSAADLDTLQRKTQGATKERMLRELTEAVEVLTAERPLVLWLEDLHWSDYSTLDLVAFLARRRQPARLLVIGTSRPVEGQAHPLQTVKQELHLHGQCQELTVGFLRESEVAAYLAVRFPPHRLPAELARVIHQRTEGNPLFMRNVVEDLVVQGAIVHREGRWELQGRIEEVAVGVPQSLRELVVQQLTRLTPEEQQVLEVGSVAGAEFSAAAVAAGMEEEVDEVENRCESVVRRNLLLQACGTAEWPDGTVAARYGFIHALYQEVVYGRVTAGRRARLHWRIGEREEQAYGKRAREIVVELAVHFEHGRDYPKAVQYLQHAGQNALRRSAHQEAVAHLTKALELLQTLPDTPERVLQELRLQIALGAVLIATRGDGAPEVEHAYRRARELCQQVGETPQLFSALGGLCIHYQQRADFHTALELAEQMLRLAQRVQNPVFLLWAHLALGTTLRFRGEYVSARTHLEQSLALYHPHQRHSYGFVYDPKVHNLTQLAFILSVMGYPEQALQRSQEALRLAQELSHAFSVAVALTFSATVHEIRREPQVAQERADALIVLAREEGFAWQVVLGTMYRGLALIGDDQTAEGIAVVEEGRAALQALRADTGRPWMLTPLASAYGKLGKTKEGLTLLAEALQRGMTLGDHGWEAELYRLKGELTLQQSAVPTLPTPNTQLPILNTQVEAEAEACFLNAIETARKQQAKLLELRAVMSLSRLWHHQGKQKEAHQMLSEIYGWFTEGFDTADLKDAKALLDALEDREVEGRGKDGPKRRVSVKRTKKGTKPK